MSKRIKRVLGRPKTGQKYYPQSLSLTLTQKAYLNKQPNASELVRKIIDDLIAAQEELGSGMKDELKVISTKHYIERLEKEAEAAFDEWTKFYQDHFKSGWTWHEKDVTKDGEVWDKETGEYKPAVGETVKHEYDLRVLRALKTRVKEIEAKIVELQQKVVA